MWTTSTTQIYLKLTRLNESVVGEMCPNAFRSKKRAGVAIVHPRIFQMCLGEPLAETSSCGMASWISFNSTLVSLTFRVVMFSSKFFTLVVPGMGTTSGPWYWTHARVTWLAVLLGSDSNETIVESPILRKTLLLEPRVTLWVATNKFQSMSSRRYTQSPCQEHAARLLKDLIQLRPLNLIFKIWKSGL